MGLSDKGEREKKMTRKKEERREAGEREKDRKDKIFFLMREEREFNKIYIYIYIFSYSTIAVACILNISGAKNSNIVI